MSNSDSENTCTMVCWAVAALTGLVLVWKLNATLHILLALIIGAVLALILGIVLTRLFCIGEEEDVLLAPPADLKPGSAPETPEPIIKAAEEKPAKASVKPAAAEKAAAPKAAVKKDEVKKKPAAPKKTSPAEKPATAKVGEAAQPKALKAAREGNPDDLKLLKGVGPSLEKQCNELGYYHFDQIAAWSADEVAWVDENLKGFKGRVSRDNWIAQAKILAAGGSTEFSKRAQDGKKK